MKTLNIAIIIVSNTRTHETDNSGKKLSEMISNEGHVIVTKEIVKDDIYAIRKVASDFILNKEIDAVSYTHLTLPTIYSV